VTSYSTQAEGAVRYTVSFPAHLLPLNFIQLSLKPVQ